MTTLEHIERKERREERQTRAMIAQRTNSQVPILDLPPLPTFYHGWMQSIRETFGKKWWLWPWPIQTKPHKGVLFERVEQV